MRRAVSVRHEYINSYVFRVHQFTTADIVFVSHVHANNKSLRTGLFLHLHTVLYSSHYTRGLINRSYYIAYRPTIRNVRIKLTDVH